MRFCLPAALGRRFCWGWAELLPWGTCTHGKLCSWSSLEPISQVFLCLPLSSCRGGWRRVLRGQEGAASEASAWARTCVEWWRLQILQLITCPSPGVNRWLTAPTAGTRKLLISSLQSSGSFAHPSSLIYPASWPPYCQLRITALISPPGCLCNLSAAAASRHAASWVTTHAAVAFSLWRRKEANEKERVFCTLSPADLPQRISLEGKMQPWICHAGAGI